MSKLLRIAINVTLALIPLTGAIFVSPALADTWVRVTTDEHENIYYVAAGLITGDRRYKRYWMSVLLDEPSDDKGGLLDASPTTIPRPASSYWTYNSIDCQADRYRILETIWYDNSNKVIGDYKNHDKTSQEVERNTTQMRIEQFVCSH